MGEYEGQTLDLKASSEESGGILMKSLFRVNDGGGPASQPAVSRGDMTLGRVIHGSGVGLNMLGTCHATGCMTSSTRAG